MHSGIFASQNPSSSPSRNHWIWPEETKESQLPDYKRGDIWLAALDPVVGSEQGNTRPVVIIQNDIANEYSPVVVVAAITTTVSSKDYPTEVRALTPEGGLRSNSTILLNQVRTIDKRRLVEYWGTLNPSTMERVNTALKISLGLVPV